MSADRRPPALSVIVPCYQSEATVAQTLESVRAQRFRDWECIIVNDGSTDRGPEIAAELSRRDPRVRVVHKPNGGLASARNFGVTHARAPLIHFLDADDLVYPDAYRTLVGRLRGRADIDIAYCRRFDSFDSKGRSEPRGSTGPWDYQSLNIHEFFPIHATVLRKRVLERVSGFDESLFGREDWEFWLRVARAGIRMEGVDRCLIAYRRSPGSMSRNNELMYRSLLRIVEFLTVPDPRVRDPLPQFAQGFPEQVVRRTLLGTSFYHLGFAVTGGHPALAEQILTDLDRRGARPEELDPFMFYHGVRNGCNLFILEAARQLPRLIAENLDPLRSLQARLKKPDLLEGLIDFLLAPLREACEERDRLRHSTTFRLGRLITRWKWWS